MIVESLLLAVGLILLVGGGDVMVRGATGLARSLGVSPLAIGLTVVAFGTSAPELAVNLIAAWTGRGDISFGNIFGSNMANIGLIVGLTALIKPISIQRSFASRELPMMLIATVASMIMGFDAVLGRGPDRYSRGEGMVLLLLFVIFLLYTVGDFVRQRGQHDATQLLPESDVSSTGLALLYTVAGLAGLVGGAHLTVESAVSIARAMGVSEVIIGLTVLAVGTSLPELVASVTATLRGHVELAIGNVVGSNIFNLLLVLGVTNVVQPFPVPAGGHVDLVVLLALSVVLLFVSSTAGRRIIRTEATILLVMYLAYLTWRATLGSTPA